MCMSSFREQEVGAGCEKGSCEEREAGERRSSPGASFFTGPPPNLVAQAIVSVTPSGGGLVCWLARAARCSQKSMQGDKQRSTYVNTRSKN